MTIPNHYVNLRAVEPEDVDFMLDCESDSDISRWSDCRAPISRAQLLSYALTYDADPFSAGQLRLIMEAGEPVGIIDLYDINDKDSRAFVGICVHPSFRKNGFALAALNKLLHMCRQKIGIKWLLAKISVDNIPALNLFYKSGYKEVALLPHWHRIGNKFYDFYLLSAATTVLDRED